MPGNRGERVANLHDVLGGYAGVKLASQHPNQVGGNVAHGALRRQQAYWDTGRAVVHGLLPEGHQPRATHPVSRALVDVYASMIAVELGDPDEAQRRSHELDPDTISSTVWRASHLIMLARGADLDGSREATLHLLIRAADASTETVQYSPVARDLIERMVKDAGATIRPDVEALARRTGILTS